jgi:hypothetical protein
MIYVLPKPIASPMFYSNWLMEFIFMNPSKVKSCISFSLYFSIMKVFKDMGE